MRRKEEEKQGKKIEERRIEWKKINAKKHSDDLRAFL